MQKITFHILEGIDKGKVFRAMPLPVTIGREEGNHIRLNDERVSRFHAKIQADNDEIILTDLESTNGTKVNGNVVHIRRLKAGDRVHIGRSLLLFGSEEEIRDRISSISEGFSKESKTKILDSTDHGTFKALPDYAESYDHDIQSELPADHPVHINQGNVFIGNKPLPPLPQKLTASQAARLAELFEFLHRHLTLATENMCANEEGSHIALKYSDWQKIQSVQLMLAKYARAIIDPDVIES